MYDVIVVGGRCAGSSLGMLLSRQGARVLVVDRATFPSEIPHGHFIHRHGPKRLQRWGVLDQIAATTPAITSGIFDAGDFPLRVDGLFEGGAAWAYGPRRSTLDHILLDAAVQAGAEVRPGFSVDEYVFEGGRVAGIRGHDRNGSQIEERASLVVGADGRRSGLARGSTPRPTMRFLRSCATTFRTGPACRASRSSCTCEASSAVWSFPSRRTTTSSRCL